MTGPATDAAELAAEELIELLDDDNAAFDELLNDVDELLDETTGAELTALDETLDAEELGATEARLEDDCVNAGALDELLATTFATDDLEDDAREDAEDELTTLAPSGAAAVNTNTDLIADQLPTASPALTPYK